MISPQPVFSLKYFRLNINKLPRGIKRLFYLSWEDALWDILRNKNVAKGTCILLPDFFCTDVEKNILLHGYKKINYKINKDLTADKKDFENKINRFDPSVIVIFHPVGIKSNLMDNIRWLKKTVGARILIEDCAHRVVDPKEIKIIKQNHFIIDSLRKVLPLQGSNVYGKSKDLCFCVPPPYQSYFYSLRVKILWFLMILAWSLKFNRLAEKFMICGYDLIGDSRLPARGGYISNFLSKRINSKKIRKAKILQAEYYEKRLENVLPQRIPISKIDKGNLRGYPVILSDPSALKMLRSFCKNGLLLRFELSGSNWSKKQRIIYLPLGIHITKKQQVQVTELSYNIFNA